MLEGKQEERLLRFLVGFVGVLMMVAILLSVKLYGHKVRLSSSEKREPLKVGTVIPDFMLPDLNWKIMTLSEFRGRNVLLILGSPHCGATLKLYDALGKFLETHKERDVEVLVLSAATLEKNRETAAKYRLNVPVFLANLDILAKTYSIPFMPYSYLVDKRGIIIDKGRGWLESEKILSRMLTTAQRSDASQGVVRNLRENLR